MGRVHGGDEQDGKPEIEPTEDAANRGVLLGRGLAEAERRDPVEQVPGADREQQKADDSSQCDRVLPDHLHALSSLARRRPMWSYREACAHHHIQLDPRQDAITLVREASQSLGIALHHACARSGGKTAAPAVSARAGRLTCPRWRAIVHAPRRDQSMVEAPLSFGPPRPVTLWLEIASIPTR